MTMSVRQLSVKIFAADGATLDQDDLIPIFHRWIREKRVDDQLLFDVADYRHVPEGPGVMLIANEAHYGLDEGGGGLGLLYAAKRDPLGELGPKLRDALSHALRACAWLEDEPSLGGGLRFQTARLEIKVMDRLSAPSDDATAAALTPEIAAVLGPLYGGAGLEIQRLGGPRAPLGVEVRVSGPTPGVAELLGRL